MATTHSIGETIQLSLAPVFVLVAIGSLLNVITQRLGRIIDRARHLEAEILSDPDLPVAAMARDELAALSIRMRFSNWAVSFCSASALLVALLVAILFLIDLAGADASRAIAILFILAMSGVIIGLCAFLMEIYVATRTIRVRSELLKKR
ncbi:MAG: DUF2721 domain-containing protein [Pseudomonadota bacterium]